MTQLKVAATEKKPPRWYLTFWSQFHALYCLLRRMALPYSNCGSGYNWGIMSCRQRRKVGVLGQCNTQQESIHHSATGQFDKKLTRLWGVCSTLHKARILRDSLLGERFLVGGWAASPAMAKAVALFHIVDKARNRGVVSHALEACMGRAFLRSEISFLQWLGEVLSKTADHGATPPSWDVAPPSFFNMLKWKSQECHPETPVLKWRDVISFLRHPFRGWGRLVGRALQLVVLEVAGRVFSFGFQNMLGVRDQVIAATRLVGQCYPRSGVLWSVIVVLHVLLAYGDNIRSGGGSGGPKMALL